MCLCSLFPSPVFPWCGGLDLKDGSVEISLASCPCWLHHGAVSLLPGSLGTLFCYSADSLSCGHAGAGRWGWKQADLEMGKAAAAAATRNTQTALGLPALLSLTEVPAMLVRHVLEAAASSRDSIRGVWKPR